MDAYSLGKQFVERAGHQVLASVDEVFSQLTGGRLELGHAVTLPRGGDLSPHVILVAWWGAHNEFSRPFIYKCVIAALRQAFENGFESVALPAMGSGSTTMNLRDFGTAVQDVLRDLDGLRNSSDFPLKQLVIVSDRAPTIELLASQLRPRAWRHQRGARRN